MILPFVFLPFVAVWALETDPVAFFVNYGVAGVVIGLLLTGWLYTKPAYQALEKQNTQLAEALKAVTTAASGQAIPAMAKTLEVQRAGLGLPYEDLRVLVERLEQLSKDE